MLTYFEHHPALRVFKSQIGNLKLLAEACSRQLRGWADSLQNSDIKGPRHLNTHSRKQWEEQKSREKGTQEWFETQKNILRNLPSDAPARKLFEQKHGTIE